MKFPSLLLIVGGMLIVFGAGPFGMSMAEILSESFSSTTVRVAQYVSLPMGVILTTTILLNLKSRTGTRP